MSQQQMNLVEFERGIWRGGRRVLKKGIFSPLVLHAIIIKRAYTREMYTGMTFACWQPSSGKKRPSDAINVFFLGIAGSCLYYYNYH